MRIIGLDIHRAFAEAVALDDGKLRRLGRIDMRRDLLAAFAEQLSADDIVVVEATGNAAAVAAVLAPHVKKVVIANPMQVRVIAHAKNHGDCQESCVRGHSDADGGRIWQSRKRLWITFWTAAIRRRFSTRTAFLTS
jgi:transposase